MTVQILNSFGSVERRKRFNSIRKAQEWLGMFENCFERLGWTVEILYD